MYIQSKESSESLDPVNSGSIIMGKEVAELLPCTKLYQIVTKVSHQLAKYPHKMLQFTPEELLVSMESGRVILCLNQHEKILAFGHIWYYGQGYKDQAVFEFGSWVSFKKGGFGKKVIEAAIDLAANTLPDSSLISVVEANNIRAQQIIEEVGGSKFAYKYSEKIKTSLGPPAFMKIYNITKARLGPNAPIFRRNHD
jgi:hypothetical protein